MVIIKGGLTLSKTRRWLLFIFYISIELTEEIPVALPGGFPSYTEVILKRSPNIKLCVTVDNFDWKLPSDVREDDSLFEVPADCKESPKANLKKLRDALKL